MLNSFRLYLINYTLLLFGGRHPLCGIGSHVDDLCDLNSRIVDGTHGRFSTISRGLLHRPLLCEDQLRELQYTHLLLPIEQHKECSS